jgi:hypothetical protein
MHIYVWRRHNCQEYSVRSACLAAVLAALLTYFTSCRTDMQIGGALRNRQQ